MCVTGPTLSAKAFYKLVRLVISFSNQYFYSCTTWPLRPRQVLQKILTIFRATRAIYLPLNGGNLVLKHPIISIQIKKIVKSRVIVSGF